MKSDQKSIIKESSKVDLHEWLSGGKPRTKTVRISNDPNLAVELDELGVRLNELAERIENLPDDDDAPRGIADDDPADELRAEWERLFEQHQELAARYEETLMDFTFRSPRPSDDAEIEADLKASKMPNSRYNMGFGFVAHLCVDPGPMTYNELKDALEVLGNPAFLQMNDAVVELSQKRKDPTAPLSLRP